MTTKTAQKVAEFLVTPQGKEYFKDRFEYYFNDWLSEYMHGDGLADHWGNVYDSATKEQIAYEREDATGTAMRDAMYDVFEHLQIKERKTWDEDIFRWFNKVTITRSRNAQNLAKKLDKELARYGLEVN